ncbi:glycosyltransferase family 2 protein [Sphingomonas corticis]|jgi:cellulose synthase/poly-beta-1,6-N-acetylglucosamine synthase-like glycosyltransferase|uniref:Glycosyltransferase n=1 Tax=Sphingomonas corticis TaxID=2722791 RepID=A0ABX1CIY0_9SPHN|nr:glycosyltransferase family 2 protein [Sphingomonas corticis]NJR77954.1 glycosyltransferase [Sphingomonas corticis]
MLEPASLAGWGTLAVLAVPTLTFVAECAVALAPSRPPLASPSPPPFAVLIPAHDEAAGIAATVTAARAQLRRGDRMLVVADNCTDATAHEALAAGAAVCVRSDPARRGKGYALDAGRAALSPDPPAVVVVLDADCLPEAGALAAVAAAAAEHRAAVQGLYLLTGRHDDAARSRLSTFAFLVKNLVRQRALARVGAPVLLQGTGMGFPWATFAAAPLGGSAIVEDMELGLELARAGTPVRFLEQAIFRSAAGPTHALPAQRTRWEHGSLGAAWRHLPRLAAATVRGRRALAPLVLDLTVPPLALLVLMLVAHAILFLVAGTEPGGWSAGLLAALTGAVLVVWHCFGRGVLPAAALLRVPMYLLWKVPVYTRFVGSRQRAWVRTERG